MAFVPGEYADMTLLRALRTGSITPYLSGGGMKLIRLMGTLNKIFKPLEEARREAMKNRSYIYLIIIGVMPEFQVKV